MDSIETKVHSFIVKLWLEETDEDSTNKVWRGHITHVPDGKNRYLKDLSDVADFIAPYLEEMGVEVGKLKRLQRWLKRSLIRSREQ